MNSDGAGSYVVIWKIEKGVFKDRYIAFRFLEKKYRQHGFGASVAEGCMLRLLFATNSSSGKQNAVRLLFIFCTFNSLMNNSSVQYIQ